MASAFANSLLLSGVALVFCSWAVSLGGLAGLQDSCYKSDIKAAYLALAPGLVDASLLSCYQLYRFFWFIICAEFALIVASVVVVASPALFKKARLSLLGLYAVLALLYINMTNTFYTTTSMSYFRHGDLQDRSRTMVAGSLMTAVANLFVIILLGLEAENGPAAANSAAPVTSKASSAV